MRNLKIFENIQKIDIKISSDDAKEISVEMIPLEFKEIKGDFFESIKAMSSITKDDLQFVFK